MAFRQISRFHINSNRLPSVLQTFHRQFNDDFSDPPPKPPKKFQVFRESDAPVILDVDEERKLRKEGIEIQPRPDVKDNQMEQFLTGVNLERGLMGVFDIKDLVDVLKKDNAKDVFVCCVDKKLSYVDYLCVVTAQSKRHMVGLAEMVKKLYKMKRAKTDKPTVMIEGKGSTEWLAMDLGNIALHIFNEEARAIYDLESLWALGPEFDRPTLKRGEIYDPLLDRHSMYLDELKPKPKEKTEAPYTFAFKE